MWKWKTHASLSTVEELCRSKVSLLEVAISTDSSMSIVRLLLVRNYYACALVLIVQDQVKLFQNGGMFLLAGDTPIIPMV